MNTPAKLITHAAFAIWVQSLFAKGITPAAFAIWVQLLFAKGITQAAFAIWVQLLFAKGITQAATRVFAIVFLWVGGDMHRAIAMRQQVQRGEMAVQIEKSITNLKNPLCVNITLGCFALNIRQL